MGIYPAAIQARGEWVKKGQGSSLISSPFPKKDEPVLNILTPPQIVAVMTHATDLEALLSSGTLLTGSFRCSTHWSAQTHGCADQ